MDEKGALNEQEILTEAQKASVQALVDLRVAQGKHRVMRNTFKGVMPWKDRQRLHKIGANSRAK